MAVNQFGFLNFQNRTWSDMFAMAVSFPSQSPSSSLLLLWLCWWYSIFWSCPPPTHISNSSTIFKIQLKPLLLHEAFQLYQCIQYVLSHIIQPYECLSISPLRSYSVRALGLCFIFFQSLVVWWTIISVCSINSY